MRFVKMHGLRNDFVVVDGAAERVADPSGLARRICLRHTGVGADGLILVLPPDKGVEADARMAIWNSDGSEAEMCGNGIRCVCKFAHDRGLCRRNPMRVQTKRGVLALDYTLDRAGLVENVTVDMGEPILDAAKVPVRVRDLTRVVDERVDLRELIGDEAEGGLDGLMTCVSMGNPHAIFYCRDVDEVSLELMALVLHGHPMFPNGTNIHVVQVLGPNAVKVRTAERGAGLTLACGTGGAAVCVAGALTGRTERRLRAHMPGGDLDLDWSEATNRVSMTGPAAQVFSGEWPD